VETCKTCYFLEPSLFIDEKYEAFREKCGFKKYDLSKPNEYGIKIYALVDTKVLYAFNLEI
jgi:hypothetical protein